RVGVVVREELPSVSLRQAPPFKDSVLKFRGDWGWAFAVGGRVTATRVAVVDRGPKRKPCRDRLPRWRPAGGGTGYAIGGELLFGRRLSSHVDRLCPRRNVGAMGAGPGRFAHADDGGRERHVQRHGADRGRCVSMDAAQGRLPATMPVAVVIHSTPRRISLRPAGHACAWCPSWRLLHRLLLGLDGIALRWRSDERAVDRRDRDLGAGREGGSRRACDFAYRRGRAFRSRRMAVCTSTTMNGTRCWLVGRSDVSFSSRSEGGY